MGEGTNGVGVTLLFLTLIFQQLKVLSILKQAGKKVKAPTQWEKEFYNMNFIKGIKKNRGCQIKLYIISLGINFKNKQL